MAKSWKAGSHPALGPGASCARAGPALPPDVTSFPLAPALPMGPRHRWGTPIASERCARLFCPRETAQPASERGAKRHRQPAQSTSAVHSLQRPLPLRVFVTSYASLSKLDHQLCEPALGRGITDNEFPRGRVAPKIDRAKARARAVTWDAVYGSGARRRLSCVAQTV